MPYNNTEKPQQSDDHFMSKRFGDTGKEKLNFNMKKSMAELGLWQGSQLPRMVGGEGRKTGQNTWKRTRH